MVQKLDYQNHIVLIFFALFAIMGYLSYSVLLNSVDQLNAMIYALVGSAVGSVTISLIIVQVIIYKFCEISRNDYLFITSNKDFADQFLKLKIKKTKVTVNDFNKAVDLYQQFILEKENQAIDTFKMSLIEKEEVQIINNLKQPEKVINL